jgi:hypothetical protein
MGRTFCPGGVYFDGSTRIKRSSLIATDSPLVSNSFFFKTIPNGFVGTFGEWWVSNSAVGANGLSAETDSPIITVVGGFSDVTGPSANGVQMHTLDGSVTDPPGFADDQWHHCFAAGDLSNGTDKRGTLLIDGQPHSRLTTSGSLATILAMNGLDFLIGNAGDEAFPDNDLLIGSIAEFYLNLGTSFLNTGASPDGNGNTPLVSGALAKFYDGSCPVDLGDNGQIPTGSSPTIYLRRGPADPATAFLTNHGTGGNFLNDVGTLQAAAGPCVCGGQHSQGHVF